MPARQVCQNFSMMLLRRFTNTDKMLRWTPPQLSLRAHLSC